MSEFDQQYDSGEQASYGPGARLRAARQAAGMSIGDVSQAIKLSPRQVEALEADDYEKIGGHTFVRGFLRNYAKLMHLDADRLLAELEARNQLSQSDFRIPENENVRMPVGAERTTRRWAAASVVAAVLLAVALVLYFDLIDFSRMNGSSAPAASSPAESSAPNEAGPTTSPQSGGLVPPATVVIAPAASGSEGGSAGNVAPPAPAQPSPSSVGVTPGQPVAATPPAASAPAASAESATPAPVAPALQREPDMHHLVFTFGDESWVEVRDAKGKAIFSQLNAKGSRQVVQAKGTVSLVIGNANAVKLEDNDQPVDLKPHIKVEVARLTLK